MSGWFGEILDTAETLGQSYFSSRTEQTPPAGVRADADAAAAASASAAQRDQRNMLMIGGALLAVLLLTR